MKSTDYLQQLRRLAAQCNRESELREKARPRL